MEQRCRARRLSSTGKIKAADRDRQRCPTAQIVWTEIKFQTESATEDVSVREVISRSIIYCYEDQSVTEAAKLMGEMQIRRLPILNRDKRMVGIVSLGDIAEQIDNPKPAGEALAAVSRG